MKRFFLLLTTLAVATSSYAEGYQVNTLSAKQLGMGHVGVAMKLNSESLFFNPAATAFQTSKFDISVGMTGIAAKAEYAPLNNGAISKSDNPLSTPLYVYFNYKATDDLAIGIGLNTPYGSSMNWGPNWAGAHLVQEINLQSFSLQPTVSYKFWDKLSVGVGLSIVWGNFDLSRSMFQVGASTNVMISGALMAAGMTPDAVAPIASAGDNALVSAKLIGDAKIAWGVNLGVMYDINKKWTLGLSYRSKTQMLVEEGTAELNYLNSDVKELLAATKMIPAMDQGTFTASLPAPANVTFGTSFRPTEKWELAVDLQWVGWSAYENLNVVFNETELKIQDINSIKNYENSMIYRVGAQYHATKCITARVGMYLDETPVKSEYLNPETPSMTKLGFTAGLTIRATDFMSIDLSYGYVTGADSERFGSYEYTNPLVYAGAVAAGKTPAEALAMADQPFEGNYSVSANMFSVGLSFNF